MIAELLEQNGLSKVEQIGMSFGQECQNRMVDLLGDLPGLLEVQLPVKLITISIKLID